MEKEVFETLAVMEKTEQSDATVKPILARVRELIAALLKGYVEAGKKAIEEIRKLDWREETRAVLIEVIRRLIARVILQGI
ncbi:hypothetical protein A3A67_03220 [Candidatus Peribacteria bacterium RIFCSPLOWO2_01_FULL_51_18]|nr:MAG: hypothetical protein A3C52_01070 [Candidatus Peribacteria bacterium RIFCSPHIGHO2_02_FULL_51_15]OGJ66444.1 MAG: hypothetical protein A3A67_03220 [Candidatus Peribacteria bacterium RIFCSPLOWO2_01_FULL_51_18]OGJ68195.1 MAG: hypothetical protein A3J34_00560 [Candidatus Peribacteria bacterium RIFCSPLOWO2_02_FULL_51_10]